MRIQLHDDRDLPAACVSPRTANLVLQYAVQNADPILVVCLIQTIICDYINHTHLSFQKLSTPL